MILDQIKLKFLLSKLKTVTIESSDYFYLATIYQHIKSVQDFLKDETLNRLLLNTDYQKFFDEYDYATAEVTSIIKEIIKIIQKKEAKDINEEANIYFYIKRTGILPFSDNSSNNANQLFLFSKDDLEIYKQVVINELPKYEELIAAIYDIYIKQAEIIDSYSKKLKEHKESLTGTAKVKKINE